MLIAVDHIVLRVSNLDKAVDTYRRLGFTVTHLRSDEVAYIVFGDFYLELRQPADRTAREGLHTLAVRTDDLDAEVSRLRRGRIALGDPVEDPIPLEGGTLSRRTAEVDANVPIRLVDREGTGNLGDLVGDAGPHPNTATVLERTYVAVESIDDELAAFEEVLGIPAPEPEMGTVIMSMMSVFYLGEIGIAVAEPRGDGPTADALAANGPGMFQVLFRAEHLDEAERVMVDHGMPAPARGTRLSGEGALLVGPENACGTFVAMAGMP